MLLRPSASDKPRECNGKLVEGAQWHALLGVERLVGCVRRGHEEVGRDLCVVI